MDVNTILRLAALMDAGVSMATAMIELRAKAQAAKAEGREAITDDELRSITGQALDKADELLALD